MTPTAPGSNSPCLRCYGRLAVAVVLALAISLTLRPRAPGSAYREPPVAASPPQAPASSAPSPQLPEVTRRPPPLLWYRNTTVQRSAQVVREWRLIGGVGVNIVWVDIMQPHVRCVIGLAQGADPERGYFPRENFYRIVKRYQPRAAINGTFFHILNGQPTGSVMRHGKLLYDGRWGTTIMIDRQGHVRFRYRSGTYGHRLDWRGVYNAITTGPTLVRNGRIYLHPREEGFRDPRVLGKASRSAIGLTTHSKLVLVTVHTPVSLNKLAHIMLRLGCLHAANLDGGSSSALYCNGRYVTIPKRRLSNVILVYD